MCEKLVSIVVPVYNQEKYLDISIPSIRNQTYTNLEIILVDDGSTDQSAEILAKYEKADERIKIIRKENGGLVDATIVGIQHATGDFIAFLDPDDYLGEAFIDTLYSSMEDDYDFVASGFFYDDNGSHSPYYLREDKVFSRKMLDELMKNYLIDENSASVSNRIFISRWNKLYRRGCVLKLLTEFSKCKGISLGEDTVFTFLVLKYSKAGKTLSGVNTYYYNIGNQNSMMKNGALNKHLEKSDSAFRLYREFLQSANIGDEQAYGLYYFLINSLFQRLLEQDKELFDELYWKLNRNKVYQKALSIMLKRTSTKKQLLGLLLRRYVCFPSIYRAFYLYGIDCIKKVKWLIGDLLFLTSSIKVQGIRKTKYAYGFRINRRNAFEDIVKELPILEERIRPIIEPFVSMKTNKEECPIVYNVFVFWWEGIEKAPDIVKQCLGSVYKWHPNSQVFLITKENYQQYTDIHSTILKDFERGKISVQTFSDILRFNLLKNNGGTWIDATIFFAGKYDLTIGLEDKPFETVEFSTSKKYLQYKGENCSWSGYFICSRRNSVLVRTMDKIFEEYYLKYKTYSIYFFIDAALMICKLYKIDNDVLNKTRKDSGDMAELMKILDMPYNEKYMKRITALPQKLAWNYVPSKCDVETMYSWMMKQ